MKKLIAIFLMCWLPLFMQSAWAMTTHMAFDDAHLASQHTQHEQVGQHCAHKQTQHASQHHTCGHCIMCSVANASAHFNTALFSLYAVSDLAPQYYGSLYHSATLPNAYKPPILA